MKTIINNETRESKYIFEDSVELEFFSDRIETPNFIIADLNMDNASVITEVTPPADWVGNKYLIDIELQWELNPNYAEPKVI